METVSNFTPIAPHLRESAVLKMLHEDEPAGKVKSAPWPPEGAAVTHKPASFYTKVARGPGGRPFEWPPRNGQEETNHQVPQGEAAPPVPPRPANYPQANMENSHQQQHVVTQEQQEKQVENAANMTTSYPSSFKLREQAPVDRQQPARVVTSQPAFKRTQPIKRTGDSQWPPKSSFEPTQEEVREFIKPKKGAKDYGDFFAQNALPHNWAGYRPPPGTQHRGEDTSDM